MLDIWSLEHILSGVSIACMCQWALASWFEIMPASLKPKVLFLATLTISFFWEILEHYLETGLAGDGVRYWLQGVENWSNRMVTDNLMVMLGAYFYVRRPSCAFAVRVFSITWLVVHIFLLPDSMYLQTKYFPSIGCFGSVQTALQ